MDLAPALQGLSEKQRLYVQARLTGMTPIVAARTVGARVPEKSWRVLEHNPAVRKALEQGRELSAKETGVTRKQISDMLVDAYRSATNAGEMVMAARELGKLHGLYEAQKIDVNHKLERVKTEHELRALTVEELEQLVSKAPDDFIDAEYAEVPRLESPSERS